MKGGMDGWKDELPDGWMIQSLHAYNLMLCSKRVNFVLKAESQA